jgi:hypothetical protein
MDANSESKLQSVDPQLADIVRAMADQLAADYGISFRVSSAKRSSAQQQALYDARASNPYPVARPGTSKHERGQAVDLVATGGDSDAVQIIGEVAESYGLKWGGRFSHPDPVHFELQAGSSTDEASGDGSSTDQVEQPAGFFDNALNVEIGAFVIGIGLLLLYNNKR